MGNCSSAPAVKEDPIQKDPAVRQPPPPPTPAIAVSSTTKTVSEAVSAAIKDAPPSRKSKSMEIPSSQLGKQQSSEDPADTDWKQDEEAAGVEWKAKRRVSRRLSLDVKKAVTKNGSPAPAWAAVPSEQEKAAWDAQADADLVSDPSGQPVPVAAPIVPEPIASKPSVTKKQPDGNFDDLASLLKSSGTNSAFARTSKLGPGLAGKTVTQDEDQEEEDTIASAWKAKRPGKRLSLEQPKGPPSSLVAAVRKSASAPLAGEYARRAAELDKKRQAAVARVFDILPNSADETGVIIDFAEEEKPLVDEEGAEEPASVKVAQIILKDSAAGSPNLFFARRRTSRRLSLEIQKNPDESVLAAVRRTQSAPITAAAARAAMGEDAWAEAMSSTHESIPDGSSTTSSAQEAKVAPWQGAATGLNTEFVPRKEEPVAEGTELVEGEDSNTAATTEESGKEYVKVNPKGTSRRRSMDVYKKAISSGISQDAAAQMAREYYPGFSELDMDAGEDENLMGDDDLEWSGTTVQADSVEKSKWADFQRVEVSKSGDSDVPPTLAGINI